MIRAQKYMILRSPFEIEDKLSRMGSRQASGAKKKFQQNAQLWQLAAAAMATVDPEFAVHRSGRDTGLHRLATHRHN